MPSLEVISNHDKFFPPKDKQISEAKLTIFVKGLPMLPGATFLGWDKPDPLVYVYTRCEDQDWMMLHRTEFQKDVFSTRFLEFTFDCVKEAGHAVKFVVYDVDKEDVHENKIKLIGSAEFLVKSLLESSRFCKHWKESDETKYEYDFIENNAPELIKCNTHAVEDEKHPADALKFTSKARIEAMNDPKKAVKVNGAKLYVHLVETESSTSDHTEKMQERKQEQERNELLKELEAKVKDNNAPEVEKILQRPELPTTWHEPFDDGRTIPGQAVQLGNVKIIELLHKKNGTIYMQPMKVGTVEYTTPLLWACATGKLHVVEILCKLGGKELIRKVQKGSFDSCLMIAMRRRHMDIANYLLTTQDIPQDVKKALTSKKDQLGDNAMHYACTTGFEEKFLTNLSVAGGLELLLEGNALGWNPLHVAAFHNIQIACMFLLKQNEGDQMYDQKDKYNNTPLKLASLVEPAEGPRPYPDYPCVKQDRWYTSEALLQGYGIRKDKSS